MNRPPLMLGHRGLRGSALPENSLAAFEFALQQGCDGFEFDVRVTADGHAVVCHDPRWRGLAIAESNVSQLRQMPLLEDVIEKFSRRAFLDIELKVPGLERQVVELLRKFPPGHGYVISSFLPEVLIGLNQLSESTPLGILFDTRATEWQDLPVQYVLPKRSLLSARLVDEVQKTGKRLMTWTVNDKRAMLRFASWGVDGIISDKPELLVSTLRTQQPSASVSKAKP